MALLIIASEKGARMKPFVMPEIEAYAEAHSASESEVRRRLREETNLTMECPQMESKSHVHISIPPNPTIISLSGQYVYP